MMMISHHRMGDNGNGPDRVHPSAQAPQTPPIPAPQTPPVPPIQPMVIQEPLTVPEEDSGIYGRRQRSRSREPHVHEPVLSDDGSAAVGPQDRMGDRSKSPQRKESPQRQKEKKISTTKRTWNVFKHEACSTNTTSPVRINIQFTVHRPVLLRPVHKKNMDQYQL